MSFEPELDPDLFDEDCDCGEECLCEEYEFDEDELDEDELDDLDDEFDLEEEEE